MRDFWLGKIYSRVDLVVIFIIASILNHYLL